MSIFHFTLVCVIQTHHHGEVCLHLIIKQVLKLRLMPLVRNVWMLCRMIGSKANSMMSNEVDQILPINPENRILYHQNRIAHRERRTW